MVATLFTAKSKKISIYSDFKKNLEVSPLSGDITLNKDEESVKESIKNLILTDRGERLMQPSLGGNIRAMLFENITPSILTLIEDQVSTTIETFEPRAELIDVVAQSNIDDNVVVVTVVFYISNVQQPISVDVFLERTR